MPDAPKTLTVAELEALLAELEAWTADPTAPNWHYRGLLLQVCRQSLAQAKEIEQLRSERDKLQAFKTWTHQYLDAQSVPHHPPGSHGAEGCRIGDRMDWLMGRLHIAEAEMARLREQLQCFRSAACEAEGIARAALSKES